jgi:hypothetical protein
MIRVDYYLNGQAVSKTFTTEEAARAFMRRATAVTSFTTREVKGRRVCSWCKADMGEADTEYDTHGICPACLARETAKLDDSETLREVNRRRGWR